MTRTHSESGFSLIELLVAMGVLLTVSSIVTTALLQMTKAQGTIWNRTEMHSGIRGATELMQQEVGQAGRTTLPGIVTLAADVAAALPAAPCDPANPTANTATVAVNTTASSPATGVTGMFATAGPPPAYMMLTTLDGDAQETFRLGSIQTSPARITACFSGAHVAGTVIVPMGGFAEGIIPPEPADSVHTPPAGGYIGYLNGSTATKLKLFGDINGDGNMVYVEYTCDTAAHKLYRQMVPLDSLLAKTTPTDAEVLLDNIWENPGLTACFTYQYVTKAAQGHDFTFVLDVAITLTVQTQERDPVTNQFQRETKALLNVSPRNVFNTWALASIGYTDRIQSTPTRVTTLLPLP